VSAAVAPVAVEAESAARDVPGLLAERIGAVAPFLAAALTFAIAASIIALYPVGIFHDDGVYLILAKALANGDGYR